MSKMYKTIRHGENSLQYTILPQNDDFRIEGKLTSAESKCSRRSKSKRPKRRSFFAYLGLIFVCTVILGAVVVPFLVSAEFLPNPTDWFLKTKAALSKSLVHDVQKTTSKPSDTQNKHQSQLVDNSDLIGKSVQIIHKNGEDHIILKYTTNNLTNKTLPATNSSIDINNNNNNISKPNITIQVTTSEKNDNQKDSTRSENNGNPNSNHDLNQLKDKKSNDGTSKTEHVVTLIRFKSLENDLPAIPPTIVVTTTRTRNSEDDNEQHHQEQQVIIGNNNNNKSNTKYNDDNNNSENSNSENSNSENSISENSNSENHNAVHSNKENDSTENNNSDNHNLEKSISEMNKEKSNSENNLNDRVASSNQNEESQLIQNVISTTRPPFSFFGSTSNINAPRAPVNTVINQNSSSSSNANLNTRIIQVPLLKSAKGRPSFKAITNNGQRYNENNSGGQIANIDPTQTNTESEHMSKEWFGSHWPYVDPSTFFKWTGYTDENSALLPALLGFALIGIILIITVCLLTRKKRVIISSVRKRNRNDLEESGQEANATLLTSSSLSDED